MPSLRARLLAAILTLSGTRKQFADRDHLLAKAVKQQAKGPAKPSKRLRRKFAISDMTISGTRVFTVAPRHGATGLHILYLHGGAYIWDLMSIHWSLVERLAVRTGATVSVALYPLTPGATFADAHASARAVYDDLLGRVPPDRLVVAGDSAGAGLALAMVMMVRDEGRPLPACLLLFSPWLDVTLSDPDQVRLAERDPMLGINGLRAAGMAYARGTRLDDPRVSPLFGSLDALPPIAVFTGTRDLLVSDARRLAALATDDGAVRVFEYEDMVHGWMCLPVPEAGQALDQAATFVRESIAARQ